MNSIGFRVDPHTKLPTLEEFAMAQIGQKSLVPPPVQAPQVTTKELRRLEVTKDAQVLRQEYNAAVQRYNDQIINLHSVLGHIYDLVTKYNNATGQEVSDYEYRKFLSINIPRLGCDNSLDSGISTTQAGIINYQASMGRNW
jgi:hypothetical protein